MKLFRRRNRLQRLGETVIGTLDTGGSRFSLPGGAASKALKNALPDKDKALKAGLVASGLAGLTAGSAGISSLRRRKEGARDD